MTSIHYQHGPDGGWLALAHENIVLLVECSGVAQGVRTRVDDLWCGLTSADGIQGTLDELTRGGLSATPSFALVQWEESAGMGPVRAVLRGPVTLTTQTEQGTAIADATDVSTWLEQNYPSVSSCELSAGAASSADTEAGSGGSPLLPLHSGAAWASRLVVNRVTSPAAAARSVSEPVPVTVAAVMPVPVPEEKAPVAVPAEWIDPEATVTGLAAVPDVVSAVGPPAVAPAETTEESSYDYLFGETVFRSVEDAAVREAGEAASEVPEIAQPDTADVGDHDGHTIASGDIAKLRAGRKARGGVHPPAPAPTLRLYLEMANGSRESLAQPILVGRAPSVSKVSGGQIPKLLTMAGSDQDISRNHAQFAVEGGTVVVTDLHSRNGTMIILPGRNPQQLRQGEPTSVIVGTVIDLGGGVTFTVGEE